MEYEIRRDKNIIFSICINILIPTGVYYTDDNATFIGGTQQIKITEIKI